MSRIKTSDEIESLKRGGVILSRALRKAREACVVGATTEELDRIAREEIETSGGRPSFLGYRISKHDPAFSSTLCISINDEVVHGPALPSRVIQSGDVVGLDIGMWYEDLATDMATTVIVGSVSPEIQKLVDVTRTSLENALHVVRAGVPVGEIGVAVEDTVKPHGFGIIRELVGHGVGHAVHEDPQVPNYRNAKAMKVMLEKDMVIAIEPMITLRGAEIETKDDHWTIVTRDGSCSAHFEVTIAITEDGYDLITPWPDV
ncbi:MAG: type I methionyl aminopeptidase [bacterium]|nr:type I methionyl aminopeptidase [bacterium]